MKRRFGLVGSAWRRWRRELSLEFLQERLGFPQQRGVEAFGERAIDRSEEIAGRLLLVLIAP